MSENEESVVQPEELEKLEESLQQVEVPEPELGESQETQAAPTPEDESETASAPSANTSETDVAESNEETNGEETADNENTSEPAELPEETTKSEEDTSSGVPSDEIEIESTNDGEDSSADICADVNSETTEIELHTQQTDSGECHFDTMTPELITYIFSMLSVNELLNIQTVCKKWLQFGRSDAIWNMLYDETEWSIPFAPDYEVETWYEVYQMRSRYELEQIDVDFYVEDESSGSDPFAGLLDRDNITSERLIQLLGMEEFVSALQNGEENVLSFLEDTRTVEALLDMIMTHPEVAPDDLFQQRIYHIAFQTLISGIIADIFLANRNLINLLFQYLEETDFRAVPSKSLYLAKIISSLFEKFPNEMIGCFQQRETFIPSLLLNSQDLHLMDLVYKFVDCDITHQWLFEADLITRLVALLHQEETTETQENAAGVLVSILTIFQSWGHSNLVADILMNDIITGSVVAYLQSEPLSGFTVQLGIKVLVAILNLISDDLVDVPAVVSILTCNLKFFGQVLKNPDALGLVTEQLQTSTGLVPNGFGFVRLSILELLVSLLYTGFPVVVEGLVQENIFPVILDLMFEFPWNNIVHHKVVQMFSGLFCGNDDLIIKSVLESCNLVDRIALAHKDDQPAVGYLGHLRELANELIKITKHSSQVASLLGENGSWFEFVTGQLQDFNQLEGSVSRGSLGISDDELGNYDESEGYDHQSFEEYEVFEEHGDEGYEYVLDQEGDYDAEEIEGDALSDD